jgi:membrane protease subunit (stomatin/prohibitin family)
MAILDVIKYEGDNKTLVWKHPSEDFSTKSQLIVHESQEAVFFKNGVALDLFSAGRHTLDTQNIPLIRKFVNLPFGGESPFHCEVYFVNKVVSMDVLWGTRTPIPVQDAVYGIILPVGANGQFAVQVVDSKQFLTKMVGTVREFTQVNLVNAFRGILMTKIKDYIANQFVKEKITFLEITAHIDSISQAIKENLATEFEAYGIQLVNFNVNAISVPENDPSFLQLKSALAKKAEMGIIGYNYQQERTFDVLEGAATNDGAGSGVMGAGMGLGMGINLGNVIGSALGGAVATDIDVKAAGEKPGKVCGKCGAKIPDAAKFCPECGTKMQDENMVICPKCGEETIKGKFCQHCGQRLSAVCPKCGTELGLDAKFCPECGERLEG